MSPQRRLSNAELLEQSGRRARLTRDYQPPPGQQITLADCQDADPDVVTYWQAAGRLAHLGIGAPRRGQR